LRGRGVRFPGEESPRPPPPVPVSLFAKVMHPFMSQAKRRQILRDMGYAVLERAE